MDTLAQSFASLVSTNNGMFKSEKQAKFLLSQSSYEYVSGGSVMGNSFSMHYSCDDFGVTMVRKYTNSKGFVTTWERKLAGKTSVQDAKEIKRLVRLIKGVEKSIIGRQHSMDMGLYDAPQFVFDSMMEAERNQLALLNSKLDELYAA